MSMFSDPSTHLAFSIFENRGIFALLIGSGVSRAAEIPTGWEITTDLVRRVALINGVEEQPDWSKWYAETEGGEPNYSKLLGQLAALPEERRSILNSYIEPNDKDLKEGRKLPTKAHKAIADLVKRGFLKVIITTNFDRLLENALREEGVEPTVISSVDALAGAEPISHSTCYILKIHGDYKDARILNTEEELEVYPPEYDAILDRIFDEYGLIVSGWSAEWDHALRKSILRAPNRRYPLYWAARGELGGQASDLAKSRDARIIQISDADTFFSSLANRITTLEKSQSQNPISVDLLVQSSKRFLSGPEHRIQLADLLNEETDRVIARLDNSKLSPQGQWSAEEFRHRIATYEASTEALAKMAGTLGRWGDGNDLPLVEDTIGALLAHANDQKNGLNSYISIRSYPAVLVFTAYNLGLAYAERWQTLHRLFATEFADTYNKPKSALQYLFADFWEGGEKQLWENLEGYERIRTPVSDHLCNDVFSSWAKAFFGGMHSFEETFELAEVLASISSLGKEKKSDLIAFYGEQQQDGYICLPLGRSCWHRETGERILNRIMSDRLSNDLLGAGFAHGDAEFLRLAVANYRRCAARFQFPTFGN